MTEYRQLKKDLWKKMAESPFVMLGLSDDAHHSEPLTIQLDPDQVDKLYFFISKHNRFAKGGAAAVQFVSKGHDYFASFAGNLGFENDRSMIDKLWSKQVEAWFPAGKSDPDLMLVRFDIADAELWEIDMSLAGRLKMMFGGKIKPGEEGSHSMVETTAV